ncbi:hypothetical protein B4168_1972 [Anoxybacillus flavithermus]|nr:hypothetical protein B4168_1972 [Anoxybacillus flavithermus]OAO85629.1 hypothetical protein GT23_2532 [Parageobacillus thermoglucosidasius]
MAGALRNRSAIRELHDTMKRESRFPIAIYFPICYSFSGNGKDNG